MKRLKSKNVSKISYFSEDRRCEGQITFVREERGQMLTAFDSEIMLNTTIEECQARCLSADTYNSIFSLSV